jgi:hypothetical protein
VIAESQGFPLPVLSYLESPCRKRILVSLILICHEPCLRTLSPCFAGSEDKVCRGGTLRSNLQNGTANVSHQYTRLNKMPKCLHQFRKIHIFQTRKNPNLSSCEADMYFVNQHSCFFHSSRGYDVRSCLCGWTSKTFTK